MTGTHPVAVPYPLNNATSTYNGTTIGDGVKRDEFVGNPSNPTAGGIKLYNDSGNGVITSGPKAGATGIECSSCHDVHNKQAQDYFLLRGKLAGSTKESGYICLQCHIK